MASKDNTFSNKLRSVKPDKPEASKEKEESIVSKADDGNLSKSGEVRGVDRSTFDETQQLMCTLKISDHIALDMLADHYSKVSYGKVYKKNLAERFLQEAIASHMEKNELSLD